MDAALIDLITSLFPLAGVILASAAVYAASEVVMPITEWFKVRLKRRFGDLSNWITHAINAAVSLTVGYLIVQGGELANTSDGEALLGLGWPLSWLVFSAAVALRSSGVFDLKNEESVTLVEYEPEVRLAGRVLGDSEFKDVVEP